MSRNDLKRFKTFIAQLLYIHRGVVLRDDVMVALKGAIYSILVERSFEERGIILPIVERDRARRELN